MGTAAGGRGGVVEKGACAYVCLEHWCQCLRTGPSTKEEGARGLENRQARKFQDQGMGDLA